MNRFAKGARWYSQLIVAVIGIQASLAIAQEGAFIPRSIDRLPPGLILNLESGNVTDPTNQGWNRIVMTARPRLATGAIEKIPQMGRDAAATFTQCLVARITRSETDGTFTLQGVGCGYGAMSGGGLKTITPETADALGVELGFLSRRVLTENVAQIDKVRVVGRGSVALIFDASGRVLVDGKHVARTIRHLIWVGSTNGQLGLLVWQLQPNSSGFSFPQPVMHLVPAGYNEDRIMHVDGNEFFLGVPTERAFAVAKITPGKAIAIDETLARLAALPNYNDSELRTLASQINPILQALRSE